MSAQPVRHLHIVDADTGEKLDGCPACSRKDDEIAGLQRDIRGWAARYADLKRNKEAEAEANKLWPVAIEIFNYWREKCSHPGCKWDADRFYLIEPFLKKDGPELCKRAIDGAAFDPYVTTRRNGSKKRHDGWELIHRDRGKWEEFVNKAPRQAVAA